MNKAVELLELKTDSLIWRIAKLEAWGEGPEVFVVSVLLEITEKYCCLLLLLSFGKVLALSMSNRYKKV
jgi:hypothetical protein